MELANSGLASTIIQLYWNAVLNAYYDRVESVRTAAVQVCSFVSFCSEGFFHTDHNTAFFQMSKADRAGRS